MTCHFHSLTLVTYKQQKSNTKGDNIWENVTCLRDVGADGIGRGGGGDC